MWKKTQNKIVGKGGVKCYCCNSYKGKNRRKLHRLVRAKLKAGIVFNG